MTPGKYTLIQIHHAKRRPSTNDMVKASMYPWKASQILNRTVPHSYVLKDENNKVITVSAERLIKELLLQRRMHTDTIEITNAVLQRTTNEGLGYELLKRG